MQHNAGDPPQIDILEDSEVLDEVAETDAESEVEDGIADSFLEMF